MSPTSPTDAEVTTDEGVTVAYDLTGDGPPLVLIHGITESRHTWDPLLDNLAGDHAVLRVDLRGHGRSGTGTAYDPATMAGDVAAAVRAAGLSEPLVVGHSLGGIVATAYAAAHPTRGAVDVDQPLALGDFQAMVLGAEPLLRSDAYADVLGAMFEAMQGPLLREDEAERIRALRRPRQDVVLGVWGPLLDLEPAALDDLVASFTSTVTAPLLALHGSDPGDDYLAWLTTTIPTAKAEVWDDHGHYPHLVDPSRFLDRLRAFEATL